MSRFSRMLSLFAVPVLFAACSAGSTDTPFSPEGPRHEGLTLIGGNAVPPDTTPTGTTSTTSTSDGGTAGNPGAAPDTTGRGVTLIGGN